MSVGLSTRPWEGGATVENHTLNAAAAPVGAAFAGARSPWASLSVVRPIPVRTQNPVQAAGCPVARSGASRPVPATMVPLGGMTAELPTAFDNRKQKTVHKTRINAGGYGALGPHPEREPA
jgi:hypothetical protein